MSVKTKLKILAIIPARAGSKGVPNKNIMSFDGKSLLEMALDCAIASNVIDKILINSDEQSILNVVDESRNPNRIYKQLRPKHLGQDHTSIVDVALHAIENLQENYDIILLLQVTSPLRSSNDIDKIIKYFNEDQMLEAVVSVIPVDDNHPARMYKTNEQNKLKSLDSYYESQHRQNLEKVYLRNGCFYAIRTEVLIRQKTFMPKNKIPYVMNPEHLLNIDTPRDVIIGKALIKAWKNKEI